MHVIIIHEEVKCRFDVYKVLRGVFVRVIMLIIFHIFVVFEAKENEKKTEKNLINN